MLVQNGSAEYRTTKGKLHQLCLFKLPISCGIQRIQGVSNAMTNLK